MKYTVNGSAAGPIQQPLPFPIGAGPSAAARIDALVDRAFELVTELRQAHLTIPAPPRRALLKRLDLVRLGEQDAILVGATYRLRRDVRSLCAILRSDVGTKVRP